jgi:bacillithiol synthase
LKTLSTIAFEDTNVFNNLVLDLLVHKETLVGQHTNKLTISERIAMRTNFSTEQRVVLQTSVAQQYEDIWSKDSINKDVVNANINSLTNTNTYTITTGHQLCLMTGPLYFVYKLLTTINYTEQLKKNYPTYNFVPVYWMATEDHDFEEVNHFYLYNKKQSVTSANAGAVGNIMLNDIDALKAQLTTLLGATQHAEAILILINATYTPYNTLAQATQLLVHKLFGKYGLVVIDANNVALKQCMRTVFENELINNTSFSLVNNTIETLEQQGYKSIQVTPREINLFLMRANKRERIIKNEHGYTVGDTQFSTEQMFDLLKTNIEQFSPNVILRPLYQEYILPNLAYIGGGGELAYWLQLKQVFDSYAVPFPQLFLRHSALLLDATVQEKLAAMQLTVNDLFTSADTITKKYILHNNEQQFSTSHYQTQLSAIYNALATELTNIDKTLSPIANAEFKKANDGLQALHSKVNKALKQQHANGIAQALKQKEKYFPADGLQERYENVFQYINKYGFSFIDTLKAELNDAQPTFKIITV